MTQRARISDRRPGIGAVAAVALVLAAGAAHTSSARDLGLGTQWADPVPDRTVAEWYRFLMQPDNPMVPCCGEADAYWADSFEVDGDHYVAIITDDRAVPFRNPVPPGTRVVVPNAKLKFDAGNPTGHGIVFIGGGGAVLCYVAPGGA